MYLHWCWRFDFRDFDVSCLGFAFIAVSSLSLSGFSGEKTRLCVTFQFSLYIRFVICAGIKLLFTRTKHFFGFPVFWLSSSM